MNKLRSFIKTGAENQTGEIIIPPIYNDIERIDKYLGLDENNKISTISESIYLAYSPPYYDIYTSTGKIDCPFNIKYYCVKHGVLVGLEDSDGYWHVIAIESSKVKTIYENLFNIESANYGAIVCRQTNNNLFAYSLTNNCYIVRPSYYKEITLYPEGIIVNKKGVSEIYDYQGYMIFSERYKLSVINGIEINSHQIILAKNSDNLYGLFSFTGKCILDCLYISITPNKHYYNNQEYITLKTASYSKHYLLYLDSNLKTTTLYSSNNFNIELFDCGRVALITNDKETKDFLFHMTDIHNHLCTKIFEADKITPLYEGSCKHFIVWKKNKCGVRDLNGKIIIPMIYKAIEADCWHEKACATGLFKTSFWYNL